MKAKDLLCEFYDVASDKLGQAEFDDTRRPRLTLQHLQKLRKSRDAEKYDSAKHVKFLPDMYGQTASDSM